MTLFYKKNLYLLFILLDDIIFCRVLYSYLYRDMSINFENERKLIAIAMLSNIEFSPRIRELVLSIIRNNTEFSSRWACRLQSVIDELVNNAIEHGSDGKSLVTLTIFLSTADGSLEFTIADTGTGNKKTTAAALTKKMQENYEIMKLNPLSNTTIRGR